jgi:hypothetical protein
MQNDSAARPEEHAPINWVTTTVFTLTPLAALILVPWYGIEHGFSGWAWLSFVFFLWACGISITAGYHRLWSHRAYQAHASVRWFFALFGAMALQNSILIWGSQHRTHHRFVDDVDKDPYSAKRGFWFSHMGWILRDYPSGRNDFSNAKDLERDPIVMFQHRYYLPLTLGMNIGLPLALGWAVGDVWGVFLLGGLLRLVINLRRGLSQLPPHLRQRLPQRREVVAVRPHQVADRRDVVGGSGDPPQARARPVDPARGARDAVQAHGTGAREAPQPLRRRADRARQGAHGRGIRGVQEVAR